MNEKYLVTGATGFVGSNIVRTLVKNNKRVSIIVRENSNLKRLHAITSKINIYTEDLTSSTLSETIKKINPDIVFHLASYGSLPSEDNVYKMIKVNINGTVNLVNALKRIPFTLLVNTGTSSEYGIKNQAMDENDTTLPINDYAVSKLTATLFCQKEALRNSMPIVTLRLFSPFGYYENKKRFVPYIILNALENNPIKVSSKLTVRDFVFIDDVVNAYLMTVKIKPVGEIINIGSGKQHTLESVVNLVKKLTKSNSIMEWDKKPQQKRQIEPKVWQADIGKAKKILQWKPLFTLKEGLQKTINFYE